MSPQIKGERGLPGWRAAASGAYAVTGRMDPVKTAIVKGKLRGEAVNGADGFAAT
ncbi:hypothetical protein GCM10022232_82430 [Streptomyces plumbiresistens]|uniref:Uncharacterized protein n=1 Tax=Streptomyces plumbiresistens TaxID=511811 RepID=A0ABP7TD40_9ACTN